jgi:hypothetical protein
MARWVRRGGLIVAALAVLWSSAAVLANGGPFVVKYPGGDPAAKGVFARLDPSLMAARESRLRVVKEDLTVTFDRSAPMDAFVGGDGLSPVVHVSAAYTIQNPTSGDVEVDFGFPILRGIYVSPYSMLPRPDVQVTHDGKGVQTQVISNSAIYGMIRQQARGTIEAGIKAHPPLEALVAQVRGAEGKERQQAVERLCGYLNVSSWAQWDERAAALMVEYASLDLGKPRALPPDRGVSGWMETPDETTRLLLVGNMGPLAAIGEQKATQFLAVLAAKFDPRAARTYEAIFEAWGGDVRERSVDLQTGEVRPRELTVDPSQVKPGLADPTVYARVDYLDENAKLTDEERESCKAVLKNLPVVFTFAPMNLLYYRAKFLAGSTSVLTVSYRQYAYEDSADPASYQLAYVVHPASLWDEFGPINLEVRVPKGTRFRASVPCSPVAGTKTSAAAQQVAPGIAGAPSVPHDVLRATLTEKRGEILLAVGRESWELAMKDAQLTALRR